MSAATTESNLAKIAQDYLTHLNPLAEKISTDIEDVIKNYEDYWSSLKPREKEKFLGALPHTSYPHSTLGQWTWFIN